MVWRVKKKKKTKTKYSQFCYYVKRCSSTIAQLLTHLRPFSLPVYAGFGICNFVQAGDFEAICTSPLALVHVIAKGQNDLQELPQTFAADEFFGCQKNGLKTEKKQTGYCGC